MHLDPDTLRGMTSGTLAGAARTTAQAHLAECATCRDKVEVGMLQTAAPTPEQAAVLAYDISRGETVDSGSPTRAVSSTHTSDPAGGVAFIGRYRILGKLGAGGMGVVYLAEDPQLARKVAVKLLHQPDHALTERLVREARSMAKVSHPNVVGVYEVGTVGPNAGAASDATFIAMEVVTGTSLREWQGKQRSVSDVIHAYVAAGHGLAAAHAAGIVHRDFKPDNVLVGDDGRVRVTDFGLAAAGAVGAGPAGAEGRTTGSVEAIPTQSSDAIGTLTISGSVLGTPAYMAPEQFDNGNLDPRTDQFSFSVALYEALYGERPFSGRSFQELADNVRAGNVRPAPAGSRVSRALRQILLRGMAVLPGDRFPTLTYMLAQLGRDRARPWRRASRALAAFAVLLALGLVADWTVRDRGLTSTRIAFADTGKQFDRAVRLLGKTVDALSNRALVEPALRQVSGNYDDADFGLGTEADDVAKRERLHELLVSADLVAFGRTTSGVLAIADKKGRLLYTGAMPSAWGGDLLPLPSVKDALDGKSADSMTLIRDDDPTITAAKVLGPAPIHGPWLLFTRALVLGGSVGALYLQLVDSHSVLEDVKLDDVTQLALVAPDGSHVGDVPPELLDGSRGDGVTTVVDGTTEYEVQTRPMYDLDGKSVIAHFVMARPLPSVLSLFPGARTVFAIAALLSLLVAAGTAWLARQITGARVA